MGMSSVNLMSIVNAVIAVGALVVSIISLIKANKVNALQAKVAELDCELKSYELDEAKNQRAACVEARLVSVGKGRKLRFCNVGKSIAKDVNFEVLDEKIRSLIFKDHVPYPELGYQKSFDEVFITAMGLPMVFDVEVTWTDENGEAQRKISHISR